jgi:ABC-type uncharacterized transport system substrate-binding protein
MTAPDSMDQIEVKLPTNRARIHTSMEARLRVAYNAKDNVAAGGLRSYGPNFPEYRRAAEYVDKILRGTKPGDIPVEQPSRFELIINLKIAKALGLEVPPTLIARADEVIGNQKTGRPPLPGDDRQRLQHPG